MEATDIQDVHVSPRFALPAKAIATMLVLAALTTLLTWRAWVLEKTLEQQREEPALVDKPAPDFSASTLDGRTVSLADFRGQKKVVVSFWASWCGPCRLEMPALIKFYQKNHSASSEFEILAISIDEDTKDAADFATAQKLNFPVLLDPHQKVANAYEVEGIPTMFVIDKDGKVKYGHIGYDMTMEYRLAYELGIKEKKQDGGEDGNAGH
jgi:peroxiredoxin